MPKKLSTILRTTRRWAEKTAIKECCYGKDLMGLCAITSKKLFSVLKENGFNPILAYNSTHCFIILKNRIMDLTATQFGNYPEIFIYKPTSKLQHKFHKIEKQFNNTEELSDWQINQGWPKCQI